MSLNYDSVEVMNSLHPRVVVKNWLRELEKEYDTITWLCCVVEKLPEHCLVSCIVLFAKTGYLKWRTLMCGLLGRVIKNMDHAILNIVIAYSIINDCV